ncbi:MAG: ADP-ribosylglycohydrolase family protein, partial [Syntrophorhabdus sp.]|nr:ADP-ribosylglycohydrolase family protein [Syntrophorhabdus sp.]
RAFLESDGYEDAVRKAISIGGDSDTIACITGGIAEAFYKGVPQEIVSFAMEKLDNDLRQVVIEFQDRFMKTR